MSTAPRCVKCSSEMQYGLTFYANDARDDSKGSSVLIRMQVCNDLECTNYGLLQLGKEGMQII